MLIRLLIAGCIWLAVTDPIPRPHAKLLPSEYLDSLFAANPEKVLVVDWGDSSIAAQPEFQPGRLERRLTLNEVDNSRLMPTNGCSSVNDTTMVVTSSLGSYAFLNPETGAAYKMVGNSNTHRFGNAFGVRQSLGRVAIASWGPSWLTIYDDTSQVLQIPAKFDLSYRTPFRNPFYRPSFGFTEDAIYLLGVTNKRFVVEEYDRQGELVGETVVPFWVRYTGSLFNTPAVWASEEYLVMGDHTLPYVIVFNRRTMQVHRIVALEGQFFKDQIRFQLDREHTQAGARLYDVKFHGEYLFINYLNSLIRVDLTSTPDDVRWAYHRFSTDDMNYRTVNEADKRYSIAHVDVIDPSLFMVCLTNSNIVDFYRVTP